MIQAFSKFMIKIDRFAIVALAFLCVIFFSFGFYQALCVSPLDYQQGDFIRILYVHVPSAWMALGIYVFIGLSSAAYLVWKNEMLNLIARSSSGIGAMFAFITLITGSLWGKPVWGTWWVWDSRLTSMLILFFFYIAYILLYKSLENQRNKNNAPAVLAVVGLINIPIVKFSVNIWTTLHQPASIIKKGGPSMHSSMLLPLILMFLGCVCYSALMTILESKSEMAKKRLLRKILSEYKA